MKNVHPEVGFKCTVIIMFMSNMFKNVFIFLAFNLFLNYLFVFEESKISCLHCTCTPCNYFLCC